MHRPGYRGFQCPHIRAKAAGKSDVAAQREDPLRLKSYPGNHPYPQRTINRLPKSDDDLEPRTAAALLEVLIRAGLILILAIICYKVFSPFMIAMVWAVILAVTLYPLHQRIARRWEAGRESPQRCC